MSTEEQLGDARRAEGTARERNSDAIMERKHLEYFLAVAAHGSFTSAASALHIAQPSLSYAVRALERELGATLFHRLGRGVSLTPAGEALVRPAQQVLREFAQVRSSVQKVSGLVAGRLDIVALTTLSVDPLAPMVGAFRQCYPGIDFSVIDPEHAAAVAEMIRGGQCELGLADFSVPTTGLSMLELPEQEILAVLPPGTELSTSDRISVREVGMLDLIATPPGTSTRTLIDTALSVAGRPLRIAVETTHRAAIVPLVLTGAGATLLPRPLAEAAAALGAVTCPIDPPVARRVRLLWRSGPLSPAAEAFVGMASQWEPTRPGSYSIRL
ncbi:LysR family transcriptional regulator [Actinophytocola sp.]|uniref:LysR family transcriptional regulator n=1 Tax=Actinophytocola sp. TaxID=1872138 RepID=UPI002ED4AD99